jgi:ABC-type uncharacterized transport system substrate-binding protein
MIRRLPLFVLLMLVPVWPHPAAAHPHIFVAYEVTVMPGDPGYEKLHFAFKINALANPILTPKAPSPDAPKLDPDMLANIAAHPFYIYLTLDGQDMGRQPVRPIPQADGTYAFDLAVPAESGFGFALYDPNYFDAVRLADAGAVKAKAGKLACTIDEREVGKTAWGAIRAAFVNCGGKGAAPPAHAGKNIPAAPPAPDAGHDLLP